MDIPGGNMYIGNDVEFMIDRAVIQIKESFRFAVPYHISTFGVRSL